MPSGPSLDQAHTPLWAVCTVPKLWLRILARKNLPKLLVWNFMPKFGAEILSQNTSTVPKLLAQNSGIEKFARIFGLKTMPKFHAERIGLKWYFGGQMFRAKLSF